MTTDTVTSKNSKKKSAALFVVVALVWLVLDRLTKAYFEGAYELGQAGTNCGLFRFTLVHNTGAAWGMFGNSTFALGITSSIVCVLIVIVFAFWEKLAGHAPSALETLAGAVAPLFLPAGFGNWQASAALLTGLAAKEALLSTFGVLLRAPGAFALRAALRRLFTPLSAASFLTFTLLYTPCAAAFGAARRELGSTKTALCAAGIQCLAAYLAACVVFNAGRLMGLQ